MVDGPAHRPCVLRASLAPLGSGVAPLFSQPPPCEMGVASCPHGDLTSGACWPLPVVLGARGVGLSATLDMLVVTYGTHDLPKFLFLSQAVHS